MQNRNIWFFAAVTLVFIMLFCNRKVWLWAVLKEQISVFRNAKKEKVSLWDCLCFFVFPWVVSYICTWKLNFVIKDDLAALLTTVFSIVFTVLFGFAAVMVSKIDSDNKKEKQVAEETFVSIVSATLMSLISAVLSILLTQIESEIILKITSIGLLGSSLITIMLLLLITKRTFFLYIDNNK
jgi:uncharacterized membrane protein